MRYAKLVLEVLLATACAAALAAPADSKVETGEKPRRNIVLFVADGLRAASVDEQTAPAISALAREGVWLRSSRSAFPSVTTVNAAVLATGHFPGDTGDFGNNLYAGFTTAAEPRTPVPYLESNVVLGEMDAHYGDFLNETTLLAVARRQGYATASIGKLGPALIFDHSQRSGETTVVLDDATGSAGGIPLADSIAQRMQAAGLPLVTPGRGDNGRSGTLTANLLQQDYLIAAATRVVMPWLLEQRKPFVLVFWSRDPDATQHNHGDSPQSLVPGVNGPTSLAAIRNADDDLARLRAALYQLGIADNTDVIVTSDHGFSTVGKQSGTSASAKLTYPKLPAGLMPPGFLALDLGKALGLNVYDLDADGAQVTAGRHPKRGNAVLGADLAHPRLLIGSNNGNDLLYVKPAGDRRLTRRIVAALLQQDYVSGLFVDRKLGTIDGALSLDDINLAGSSVTPRPSIVVNFRSFDTGCGQPTRCGVVIGDSAQTQGQGGHGSLSRADTGNFMAATGPDFKKAFVDELPASNVDLGRTLIGLLDPKFSDRGALTGRQLTEILPGGAIPTVRRERRASRPAANGLKTLLDLQWVGTTMYIDAGGFAGRSLGLQTDPP